MSKVLCNVYRSTKKEGMYLYVSRDDDLSRVPEALLKQLGKLELALNLVLTPEKKLARITAGELLEALDKTGYYLQMPPGPDQSMSSIHQKNSKF